MDLDHDHGKINYLQILDTTQLPPQGGTAGLLSIVGTGGVQLPVGTTGQQPAISEGIIRYNSTTHVFEFAQGSPPVWFTNAWPKPNSVVVVNTASNLPAAVSGVITLADNTVYVVSGTVSIGSDTLLMGEKSVLRGFNHEVDKLSYTGTGTFITAVNKNVEIDDIGLVCPSGTVFSCTGTGVENFHLIGAAIRGCKTLGSFSGLSEFRIDSTDIQNTTTNGLSLSGSFTYINFNNNTCSNNTGTLLALDSSTTSVGTIRGNEIIVNSSQTGITASGMTITNQMIMLANTFSGVGTPTSGISITDIRWTLTSNYGIANSVFFGEMYINSNATATTIAAPSTYYKVAGTTVAGTNIKITHTTGRLTSNSLNSNTALVSFSFSVSSGSVNQLLGVVIYKNGSPVTSSEMEIKTVAAGDAVDGTCKSLITFSTNDYVELFIENKTAANNVTVEYMNCTIIGY